MKYVGIIILLFFTLGFRIYPGGQKWKVSNDDPKVFIRLCEDLAPIENDLPSDDQLYSQTITSNEMIDSIINDYNSIEGSFLRLADADRDSEYNSTVHGQRIIDICIENQKPNIEGYASPKFNDEGNQWIGCSIKIGPNVKNKAKRLIHTLTHEIGHCLGLDHPQDTRYAAMSYFSDREKYYRLMDDDKAGITYIYPKNLPDVLPENTFGLSCSTRQ